MKAIAITGLALSVSLALGAACDPEAGAGPNGPAVAIAVAPLSLPGITDAQWRLTVSTATATVWTRELTSRAYGDGAGSLSYVGPCDADAGANTVTLELLALYQGAAGTALVDPATYDNPGALSRTFTCLPDADVPVTFDVTLARAATQGFFDVAVTFDDLFCSAKLDCELPDGSDILLLADASGARRPTVVLGFACTADTAADDTVLYLDPIALSCGAGAHLATVDPSAGPGNLATGAGLVQSASDPVLFGAAVYRGREDLGGVGKIYWNLALGLALGTAPAQSCTLTARGTASSGPWAGNTPPAGTTYPIVSWSVPLTSAAAALTCAQHPLNGGSGVATTYATPSSPFAYSFDGGAVTEPPDPPDPPTPLATGLPTCAHVLASNPTAPSGLYGLDPDGPGAAPSHDAYCDMDTDGGGWTLVNVKTAFNAAPSTTTALDLACASQTTGDCASIVDPRQPWSEAMWRFADADAPRVTAQRPFIDQPAGFASYLVGYGTQTQAYAQPGFDRFVSGAWTGQSTIAVFHFGTNPASPANSGISEGHAPGSDRWISLWTVPDSHSNNYLTTEGGDANLRGTKCLAGHCRAAPVWFMVRDRAACGAACLSEPTPRSCAALLRANPAATSGTYAIDPDGPGGAAAYSAYCDMETDGGGWTLVHTKASVAFVPWSSAFVPACAASTAADCASAVPPQLAWNEAMWRFGATTTEAERAIWRRDEASSLSTFLLGAAMNVEATSVSGFRKTVSGVTTHHYTLTPLYYRNDYYVSESHAGGTDRWLDLWAAEDANAGNAYLYLESGLNALRGRKCIAGYCRTAPVWLMVRDTDECGAACPRPTATPASCAAVLAATPSAPSGLYTLDPDGAGPQASYSAYCDMTTDGGGWTLVKTKVSPAFNTWKAAFDPACASATASNCASAVDPALDYADVLWRFAADPSISVRWSASNQDSLRRYLAGEALDVAGTPVAGFSKTVHGVYTGPHTIPSLHFRASFDLSENHAQSDLWLDLWTLPDGNAPQGYLELEGGDTALRGTKCLAGYCRVAPVWMLVR